MHRIFGYPYLTIHTWLLVSFVGQQTHEKWRHGSRKKYSLGFNESWNKNEYRKLLGTKSVQSRVTETFSIFNVDSTRENRLCLSMWLDHFIHLFIYWRKQVSGNSVCTKCSKITSGSWHLKRLKDEYFDVGILKHYRLSSVASGLSHPMNLSRIMTSAGFRG